MVLKPGTVVTILAVTLPLILIGLVLWKAADPTFIAGPTDTRTLNRMEPRS